MLLLVSLELDIFRIKNSKKFSLGQFKYILDAILFTVTGTCEVQIYTVLVSTCIIYSDSFLIGVISIFPQAKAYKAIVLLSVSVVLNVVSIVLLAC